jgi:hypothetical protein
VTIEEERQKKDLKDRSIKTISQAEDSIQLQPRMELRSSRLVMDEWQARVDKMKQKTDKLSGPVSESAANNTVRKSDHCGPPMLTFFFSHCFNAAYETTHP